jgi:hypothetical protein
MSGVWRYPTVAKWYYSSHRLTCGGANVYRQWIGQMDMYASSPVPRRATTTPSR